MALKRAGETEFAQLMADHVLGDVHGINFLPLCTAIVWPTISGITVERRDQVRSTFFSLRAFMPSTRACR